MPLQKLSPLKVARQRLVNYAFWWSGALLKLRGHRLDVAAYCLVYTAFAVLNRFLPVLGLRRLNVHRFIVKQKTLWLVTKPDGLSFYLRPAQADIIYQSDYFEYNLRFFFDRIRSGTYIDVGAHIGKYAVLVGKNVGSKGRVIAIEPELENFSLLKRNVALNDLNNVLCLNVACFSENTQLKLYVSEESGYHSLVGHGLRTQNVSARTLDSLVQELDVDEIAAIKIDAENAEFEVLRGAQQSLALYRPVVLFESRTPIALEKCYRLLNRCQYEVRQLDPENYVATPFDSTGERIRGVGRPCRHHGSGSEPNIFDSQKGGQI